MARNILFLYILSLLLAAKPTTSIEINGNLEINLKSFFYNSSYLPTTFSPCCFLNAQVGCSNCDILFQYSYSYNLINVSESFVITPAGELHEFGGNGKSIANISGIDTISNLEIIASIRLNMTSPQQLLLSYQNVTIQGVNKLNTIEVTKYTPIPTLESELILTYRLVCEQKYGGDRCSICDSNFTGTQCNSCQYGYVVAPPNGNCNISGVCYWDRWCAPGSCNSEFTSCTCSEGFSNPPYCDQINIPPQFLSARVELTTTDGGEIAQLPAFFNNFNLTYTRYNTTSIAVLEWSGIFNKMSAFVDGIEPIPSRTSHFDVIYNSSAYGIVDQYYVVEMRNSAGNLITGFNSTSFGNSDNRSLECSMGNTRYLANSSFPAQNPYNCRMKGVTMLTVVPKNKDRISIQVYLTSGGYINLERIPLSELGGNSTNNMNQIFEERHVEFISLPDATMSFQGDIEFDFEPPFNCYYKSPNALNCSILTTDPSVTTSTRTITLSWSGYEDEASGLGSYTIQVFELTAVNPDILSEGNNLISNLTIELNATALKTQLTLPNDGIFSFIMEVEDVLGNPRYVRRIVLTDLSSTLNIDLSNPMGIPTSVTINNINWQTNLNQMVTFNWTGHFYNTNLRSHPWLHPIDNYTVGTYRVDPDYDQINGYLNIHGVNNIDGVVKFWYYNVTTNSSGVNTTQAPVCAFSNYTTWTYFTNSPNQMISLDFNRYDGEQIYFWILAEDYYNKSVCDSISVRFDSTPPVINIIGIKYLDKNMAVIHNTVDLEEVDVEFTVSDQHSGLMELYWELGTIGDSRDIGTNNISIKTCKLQDTNCVCAPKDECFNSFYTLDFTQANLNDSMIQHYQDIYLKITATNYAGLTNSKIFYFFIDTTPPTTGVVIDNVAGEKDRDFSSTKELSFYWEGFNDAESYIDFYQYACTTRCLNEDEFAYPITDAHPLVFSTEVRTANCIQVFPRRIYMTVVAFNYALLHSDPACSDGIVYDNTPPLMGNISIANVTYIPGLVKDNDTDQLWVINSNGRRFRVDHNIEDASCIARALAVDLELYPISKTDTSISISEACRIYPRFSNVAYQTVANFISVRWSGFDLESGIRDYKIGLSSTESNIASPNLVPLNNISLSTQFTSYPEGLSNLEVFYVVIHGQNHANEVTQIQSLKIQITVSRPNIIGNLIASRNNTFSTLKWQTNEIFSDINITENSLAYEIAVGSSDDRSNLIPFYKITPKTCSNGPEFSCISFSLSKINDRIHSNFQYYTLLRVTNLFGNSITASSNVLTLSFDLPTKGIIIEINQPTTSEFYCRQTMDIDHQINNNSIAVCWLGFVHQFEKITYRVGLGTSRYLADVVSYTYVGSNTSFIFQNLALSDFQNYFATVIAQNSNGEVSQPSDGIYIISPQASYTNAVAYVGYPQVSNSTLYYQLSSSSFLIEWEFDRTTRDFISFYQFSLLNCSTPTRNNCNTVVNKVNAGTSTNGHLTKLKLISGRYYFACVEACHAVDCFNPIYSIPVIIINKPPINGSIMTEYIRGANSQNNKIFTRWAGFNEVTGEEIQNYEWSYGTGKDGINLYVPWKTNNNGYYEYSYDLGQEELSTFKNYFISVQAYGRTGLRTVISTPLKVSEESGERRRVYDVVQENKLELGRSTAWIQNDRDYTPYNDRLQAVWPTYPNEYFFVSVTTEPTFDKCDSTSFYCNVTSNVYITISGLTLSEGSQYFICIRGANGSNVAFEDSVMLNCSDGIIIDTDAPIGGTVTIGHTNSATVGYQSDNDVLVLNWLGFADIERFNMTDRPGIEDYKCGLGTSLGIDDVVGFKSVGVNENCTFLDLNLKTSLVYYGTVIAIDHLGRQTSRTSLPITIDQTPPNSGSIYIGSLNLSPNSPLTLQSTDIRVHWVGIVDGGSGVARYQWGVGSGPYFTDISPFLTTTTTNIQNIGVDHLIDGSTIFVTIKATNHAGLYSLASSYPITIDRTPPVASDVFDGIATQGSIDIDYQTNLTIIQAYWNAFTDPHSLYIIYQFGIGTCPSCTNTMPFTNIGTETAASSSVLKLKRNVRYFATVKGCNQANLCTQSVSDGLQVDDTPPKAGVVWDGIEGEDIDFQGQRYLISGRWFGFHDAESGISHYEWCIGTIQGVCNLNSFEPLHDSIFVYRTYYNQMNTVLPHNGTKIFLVIRAWNHVGLDVTSSSDGFIIDTSEPYFTETPEIDISIGSFYPGYQIARNYLKVKWESFDPNAIISSHLITVYNRDELQEITSSFQGGSETSVVLTNLDLHDGIEYFAVVLACNIINLCTSSESNGVILDSSPPILGSFAFDHPEFILNINQTRNVTQMRWENYDNKSSVRLSWTGFYDLHSWIRGYHLTVGREFYGWDLTNESVVMLTPNLNPTNDVEVHNISLSGTLNGSNEVIYITLWAENKAGLYSQFLHQVFTVEIPNVQTPQRQSGVLKLQRYNCEVLTCDQQCACASPGASCSRSGACSCQTNVAHSLVILNDVIQLNRNGSSEDTHFTPFNSFLSLQWSANQPRDYLFYQVSIALKGEQPASGILDPIWYNVGKLTSFTLPLPQGVALQASMEYSVHLRAWLTTCSYATFQSSGVIVDLAAPKTSNLIHVREVRNESSDADIDYQANDTSLVVKWSGVFQDDDTAIEYYEIALGTKPFVQDITHSFINYRTNATTFTFNSTYLVAGIRIYTTVRAFDLLGLVAIEASDGIVIDTGKPLGGVVLDVSYQVGVDADYQSETFTMRAEWKDFVDLETGIDYYEWSIGTSPYPSEYRNILNGSNIGLNLRSTVKGLDLTPGVRYYSTITAVDIVGHKSTPVSSNGIIIDTTQPVALSCCSEIYTNNTIFLDMNNFEVQIPTIPGTFYQIFICVSHYASDLSQIPSEVSIKISAPDLIKTVNLFSNTLFNTETCQSYYFNFKAIENISMVDVARSDKAGNITIKDISLTKCESSVSNATILHNKQSIIPNSIELSWFAYDPESVVCSNLIALGHSSQGQQIFAYRHVGVVNNYQASEIEVFGGLPVYISVVVENCAGLQTAIMNESPTVFDTTGPMLTGVRDGNVSEDVDYINERMIWLSFDTPVEKESNLDYCEWAIGLTPGSDSLQPFTKILPLQSPVSSRNLTKLPQGEIVYTTLTCTNDVGLSTTAHTDGVTFSTVNPSIQNASISVLISQETPYPPIGAQMHSEYIALMWGGIQDIVPIVSHNITITDSDNEQTNSTLVGEERYANLIGLVELRDGANYTISLIAINIFGAKSDVLQTDVSIDLEDPTVDITQREGFNTSLLISGKVVGGMYTEWKMNVVRLNWTGTFKSKFSSHLRYEISISTQPDRYDLVQWSTTRQTFYELNLTGTLLNKFNQFQAIVVILTAYSPSGRFTTVYSEKFKKES